MEIIRWQPPWPLIQISDCEWIAVRDDPARPVAIVRYLPERIDNRYRVVRWAPVSQDRRLFEYLPTLEACDMSVTFIENEPDTGRTALTTARSPEWGRFERWFWSQTSDMMRLNYAPNWLSREALLRH